MADAHNLTSMKFALAHNLSFLLVKKKLTILVQWRLTRTETFYEKYSVIGGLMWEKQRDWCAWDIAATELLIG